MPFVIYCYLVIFFPFFLYYQSGEKKLCDMNITINKTRCPRVGPACAVTCALPFQIPMVVNLHWCLSCVILHLTFHIWEIHLCR